MIRNNPVSLKLGYMLGATVLFTYLLMVMGTFVTSTGSGLACPDWPLCYGSVKPPLEMSIWFEWGHRLLGGASGILIILSTIFVWRRYKGLPRTLMLAVLGLLALGVILGGVTVIIEAPLLSSIVHVAVISSHLVIATLVLICLIFTLRYVGSRSLAPSSGYYKLLFAVVYSQVILGILVRYSGATLACPDLPFCNGALLPALSDSLVAMHFIHRVTAVLVFLIAGTVLYKAVKSGEGVRGFAVTFGLVILQACFGMLIVYSGMFLPFIILHGATGFLLLGFLAYHAMPGFFTVERYAPEGRG
jgi:cytochrome c oxidase assembly protein subunit 15